MKWIALSAVVVACSSPSDTNDGGSDARDEKTPPTFDGGDAAVTGPDKLSDTGLYADFASRTLAPGVTTYAPRWPLWSDGADKKRFMLLPNGQTIDKTAPDDWVFPIGTKVWKEFSVASQTIETRLLWKQADDAWWEVSYAWLADGSDAIAAPSGVPNALGTNHDVPSQQDCNACHSGVRDVLIGVSAIQLGEADVPGAGNVQDALGYLHGNCGHCHNDESPLKSQSSLRLRVLTTDQTPEQTGVYRTAPFLAMKHVIAPDVRYALVPGSPDESGIAVRMALRNDPFEMPPVCTKIVDDAGVATVRDWIASLPCGPTCQSAVIAQ